MEACDGQKTSTPPQQRRLPHPRNPSRVREVYLGAVFAVVVDPCRQNRVDHSATPAAATGSRSG